MSARNDSFPYSLLGRLARGSVPVDGMLWFDQGASEESASRRARAPAVSSKDEAESQVHCFPAQIF